jgi:hypothetical protein
MKKTPYFVKMKPPYFEQMNKNRGCNRFFTTKLGKNVELVVFFQPSLSRDRSPGRPFAKSMAELRG